MRFFTRPLADFIACLRFYTRIAVPVLPFETDPHGVPDFSRMTLYVPFVGAALGCLAFILLYLAQVLELGNLVAAVIALVTLTLLTGAFHEDGLADMTDGFGGGATIERRLQIMKDSLIGSFGASALIAVFGLRFAALFTILERLDTASLALVLIFGAALSRALGLLPLAFLMPARMGGFSATIGQPPRGQVYLAIVIAGLMGFVGGWFTALGLMGIIVALIVGLVISAGILRLSYRLIGGQTGDVAGATQQLSETGIYLAILASLKF